MNFKKKVKIIAPYPTPPQCNVHHPPHFFAHLFPFDLFAMCSEFLGPCMRFLVSSFVPPLSTEHLNISPQHLLFSLFFLLDLICLKPFSQRLHRQACSSHHQIIIWICSDSQYLSDSKKISTNTETAMLSSHLRPQM